jgi:predicted HAD superfamily phosphohydrolase
MSRDWINRHPVIKNVVMLLVVGVLVFVGTSLTYDKTIEIQEIRIAEQAKTITERDATINSVTESNKRLGTIKEVTESNTVSEEQVREQVKEEYKERIAEEVQKIREEVKKTISERKKVKVMAGYTSEFKAFLMADYTFYGPFGVNAGIQWKDINQPTYTLGLSWSF